MRAWVQDGEITFVASREEVLRWSTAALESVLSHSRAEFYIRTGCSAPNIENRAVNARHRKWKGRFFRSRRCCRCRGRGESATAEAARPRFDSVSPGSEHARLIPGYVAAGSTTPLRSAREFPSHSLSGSPRRRQGWPRPLALPHHKITQGAVQVGNQGQVRCSLVT